MQWRLRKALIKVIYRTKDGCTVIPHCDYVKTTDFKYAIDLFLANHGLKQPEIVALIRID